MNAASHADLQLTILVTCGYDMLRDVGHRYAQKLAAAGNAITYVHHADLPHCGFDKTKCDVSFDFTGFDEGDEVSGQGWAEMTSPDTITCEIEFRDGDDTTFEARR